MVSMTELGFIPREAYENKHEGEDTLQERLVRVKHQIEKVALEVKDKVATFSTEKQTTYRNIKATAGIGAAAILTACGGEANAVEYHADNMAKNDQNALYEEQPKSEYQTFMEQQPVTTPEYLAGTQVENIDTIVNAPITTLEAVNPVNNVETTKNEVHVTAETSLPETQELSSDRTEAKINEVQITPEQQIVNDVLARNEINGYMHIPETFTPENMVDITQNQELLDLGIEFGGSGEIPILLDERAVPYLVNFLTEAQAQIKGMGFETIKITYSYRTHWEQQNLYDTGKTNAEGTESHHRTGLAIDMFVMRPGDVVAGSQAEIDQFTAVLFPLAVEKGLLHTLPWDTPHYVIADALGEGTAKKIAESGVDPDLAMGEIFHKLYGE